MKIKIILPATFFFISSIVFYRCSDTVTSTMSVNGTVYGYDNFPVTGLQVSIGDKSTQTSIDGNFSFENVTYPYDVSITDSYFRMATVYRNISTDKLSLYVGRHGSVDVYSRINIFLPPDIDLQNLRCKAYFTDGQYINDYADISIYNNFITVHHPDLNPVSGKLIILTYIKDTDGRIISYENYGESDPIILTSGANINYTFDTASLALNPGEESVTGSYSAVPGLLNINSSFYITFGNTYYYNNYDLGFFQGNIFNFKIPDGIPRTFNTFVSSGSLFNTGYCYEAYQVYPSVSNSLSTKSPCILLGPDDMTENIDNQSVFNFSDGGGEGVFNITLNDVSRNFIFEIITTERNFTLEGLDQLGFGSINNNNFNWYVSKVGPAKSLNDYVTNYVTRQERFTTNAFSRTFSTRP